MTPITTPTPEKTNLILKFPKNDLITPLHLVMGVVERKQTLPVLSNVLFYIQEQQLLIKATDLEIELIAKSALEKRQETANDQISKPLFFTLPGRKLLDICKALPEESTISLNIKEGRVILQSGRSRFVLLTQPPENFPNMKLTSTPFQTFKITEEELKTLLQNTCFAMGIDDSRTYLNGLVLSFSFNTLQAIASDGHRLAMHEELATIQTEENHQIILPYKTVMELQRLLTQDNEILEIKVTHQQIRVSSQRFTLTSKLIEAKIPDYKKVVPKGGDKKLVVDRLALKQALHRVAILSHEKFKSVRFEIKNHSLCMFSNNTEQEMAQEELPIEYSGEELNIGFNIRYLLDVLNTIPSKDVTINLSNASSALMIKENEKNSTVSFVIMPIRQ